MSGFLKSVENYLRDVAAGRGQKLAAWEAAKQVAQVPGEFGAEIRKAYWAWLSGGHWLQQTEQLVEWRLPDHSMLSEEKIRENYPNMSYKEAVAKATAAWETRVKRCAQHLAAGWPVEHCLAFVYTREELREALKRAGRKAA